ncbi:MAG: helix-turn-helix domain-containing protein [Candidatus Binatia bacterium]
MAAVRGCAITMELATVALGPYARVRAVSVETVQEMVSHRFGVSIADLVCRREREVSYPRQIAMYLSRMVAEASFPTIAEFGRDHTTVMYAVKTIETRRASGWSRQAAHRLRRRAARALTGKHTTETAEPHGGGALPSVCLCALGGDGLDCL